ncbi:hypothetical protein, partial [Shewanella japonica]|uniref:hypothetical protein n=1 Tax=Shewanella japonica TaxID=93973 RepID=UPI001969994E
LLGRRLNDYQVVKAGQITVGFCSCVAYFSQHIICLLTRRYVPIESTMSLYTNTPPKLILSFVCHVDILGYAQLCQEAIKSDSSNAFLNKVRDALNAAYARVRESAKDWNQKNSFEIKVFTDNIVIGYPLKSDFFRTYGESELGHIFDVLSEFQLGLAMEGFLVRGGIAIGEHYMDDDIVFGNALIEAVKQDNSGGAPKVALAPSVIDVLKRHLGFYGDPQWAPQTRVLLQDVDDNIFINYLENAFIAFPDGGVFVDVFVKHKETLTKGLTENKGIPSVRAKYEWAARYHNSVIDNFLENNPIPQSPDADEIYACTISEAQVLKEYRIDIEALTAVPSKLNIKPISPGT